MGILTSTIREDGSFTPSRMYQWLRPRISGNEINGVGETEQRRPTPVYHYVWVKHPWRRWQNWFYFRVSFPPGYIKQFARALFLRYAPLKQVAKSKSSLSHTDLTEGLKEYLLGQGAGDILGEAEIAQLGAGRADQDVGRLHVAMDHADAIDLIARYART